MIIRKIIILIVSSMMLCFAGRSAAKSYDPPEPSGFTDEEIAQLEAFDCSDDDIALIYDYANYAWEPTFGGFFVTCGGDVYSFDFIGDEADAALYDKAKEKSRVTPDVLFEICNEMKSYKKPCRKVDEQTIKLCRAIADGIDIDAAFETRSTACDAGNESVYIMTDDGAVMLYTGGDNTGTISDNTAIRVLKELRAKKIINEGWKW